MKTKILLILFFSVLLVSCSTYKEKEPLMAPPFLADDLKTTK
jgi:hypothetical protein